MKTTRLGIITALSGGVLAALALLAAGCQTGHPHTAASAAPATDHGVPGLIKSRKGAAELWTQNCMACHNIRSPSTYSDAEWEVAMLHMRIRANLTAADSEAILKFLQSAN